MKEFPDDNSLFTGEFVNQIIRERNMFAEKLGNQLTKREQFVMASMPLAFEIVAKKLDEPDSECIARRAIEIADACINFEEKTRINPDIERF